MPTRVAACSESQSRCNSQGTHRASVSPSVRWVRELVDVMGSRAPSVLHLSG